jgi:hypothetical protein
MSNCYYYYTLIKFSKLLFLFNLVPSFDSSICLPNMGYFLGRSGGGLNTMGAAISGGGIKGYT